MKSINIFCCCILVLIVITGGISCKKAEKEIQLNEEMTNNLNGLADWWNQNYGDSVSLQSWKVINQINSESEKNNVIQEMISPTYLWFPSTTADKPQSMSAVNITDPSEISDNIELYSQSLSQLIKIDNYVIKFCWFKNGNSFSTLCIADKDTLIFDPMLFNLCYSEEVSEKGIRRCDGWDVKREAFWWEEGDWVTIGQFRIDLITECEGDIAKKCTPDPVHSSSWYIQIEHRERVTQPTPHECKLECASAWGGIADKIMEVPQSITYIVVGKLGEAEGKSYLGGCQEICLY